MFILADAVQMSSPTILHPIIKIENCTFVGHREKNFQGIHATLTCKQSYTLKTKFLILSTVLRMFEYMLESRESSWGFPSTL